MDTLKTIIEVLSSLTPIVIGAAVVYIAWQQHQTNKHRLKMELFDRRYKVYDATITASTKSADAFNQDMWLGLHRDISSARFLFNSDQDVLDYLIKVSDAIKDLVKFKRKLNILEVPFSELDEKQKHEIEGLCKNIWKLRSEAIDIFSKYLTLEA